MEPTRLPVPQPSRLPAPELVLLPLSDLLPAGEQVVLHEPSGILIHVARCVDAQRDHPVLHVQQLTPSELTVFRPLVDNVPDFCPYEVLLAHFSYHRVTEQVIERMRRRWYAAQEEGVADSVLRPVRNVLSRVRLKVQELGLDVVSLLDLGYQLLPLTRRRRRSRGPRQEQDEREEE